MLRIGLTGGIASGKSTVADLFRELGAPVIDSDLLAREVVKPGTKGLATLVEHFGTNILNKDQSLDRSALREIIFQDESARELVESTLHPVIRALSDEQSQQHEKAGTPYCLFDIPLLVETKQHDRFERVLIVDVSEEIQATRVIARDNSTHEQAMKIINAQASRTERFNVATDVIINNIHLDALAAEVRYLHEKFINLALD